ncbi:MAG: hypothetical protein AABX96_01365 [Nanoarchaeota archaeon]
MKNQRQIFIGTKNGLYIFYEYEKNKWYSKHHFLQNKWISSISDSGRWITSLKGEIFYNKNGFSTREYNEPTLMAVFPKQRVWCVYEQKDFILAGMTPAGIYRSWDNGVTWDVVQNLKKTATEKNWKSHQGQAHLQNIIGHPKKNSYIYIGIEVAGVHRSKDYGNTWTDITFNLNPDVHKISFMHEDLLATTGSGIYKFEESKKIWTKINGLPLKYVQGLSVLEQKREFYLNCAKKPFGRWRINLDNISNNQFGVFKYSSKTGVYTMLNEKDSPTNGAMSKALCSNSLGEVFYGALNGDLICFNGDSINRLAKLDEQIECLKLYDEFQDSNNKLKGDVERK